MSDPPQPSRSAPREGDGAEERFQPELTLAALGSHSADYAVVGGIALIAHGVVRATLDVDVVPATTPANLRAWRARSPP